CAFPRQDLLQVFPSLSALGPTQRRNYERFPPLVMVGQMSALGQKRTSRPVEAMSALPPKADIGTPSWNVRFVPKADILHCGKERRYSITSSALASSCKYDEVARVNSPVGECY